MTTEPFGPQPAPQDERIFNRPGNTRPTSQFFDEAAAVTTTIDPLRLGTRCKGNKVFVDSWAVEKLAAAIKDLGDDAPHYEIGRNLFKLAFWMAGHASDYSEEGTENSWANGKEASLLESVLAPILHEV